jgi:hypothetical protein
MDYELRKGYDLGDHLVINSWFMDYVLEKGYALGDHLRIGSLFLDYVCTPERM